jgi:hypothetical protein
MWQYECEVCGRPATIHETLIESGGTIVSRHQCAEHGAHSLHGTARLDDPGVQAAFAALVAWYDCLSDSEKNRFRLEYRLMRRCG